MAAAVVFALAIGPAVASGEALSPWWGLSTGSRPTDLVTGATGQIVVTAQNRGDVGTAGEATLADRLPAGLEATAIEAVAGERPIVGGNREPVGCKLATLTCTFGAVDAENSKGEQVPETLRPYEQIEVRISVSVRAGASSSEQNTATVSGGGAASAASASHAIEVNGSEKFGVEDYELIAENAGGSIDARAGSHPFQLTSVLTLNTAAPEPGGGPRTAGQPLDISPALPAGLVADPAALTHCTEAEFDEQHSTADGNIANDCPADSAVGVATLTLDEPSLGLAMLATPIFNLEPSWGEPARFAIKALGLLSVYLKTSVRSGGDYGVTLSANDIASEAQLLSLKLTFWGVPGDPRHDAQRGWGCLEDPSACTPGAQASTLPFLSLPTACARPLQSSVTGDSSQQAFEQQSGRLFPLANAEMPALDGCNRLPFAPELEVTPEARQASTPSGFDVDVRLGGQEGAANPEGLASSNVRDMSVALPAGVTLNPAVANELGTCSESQIGFTGSQALDPLSEPGALTPTFAGTLPEPLQQGVNFCPNTSKLGTVKISTPILPGPLEGAVYLAAPRSFREGPPENPLQSLVAVYVVASEPIAGVLVELPGRLVADPVTGQVTATFEDMPQLPLQDVELSFLGGERAPLSTPARCGAYTTRASFTPWSAAPGEAPREASSTFNITSGPHGGGCPGASLPFAPSLTAGTSSLDAGASSPLTVTVGREDGQQAIQSVQLRLPPGLLGLLAGVPLCPEAQANAGTCGQESQIGETTLSVGLGEKPYTIAGRVYLTGPYNGTGPCSPGDVPSSSCAPFGLAIVAPARVGPFVLREGQPIVVRAKLEIDPATAALTIATSPIPSIVEGFPLQIKRLNITIDGAGGKSHFIFNPTSCDPMKIEGTITGNEGAQAPVSSSFQVANCTDLKFAPKLTALTRANGEFQGHGASLHITITTGASTSTASSAATAASSSPSSSSSAAFTSAATSSSAASTSSSAATSSSTPTTQANLRSLKLDLPQRLPARLETIQKACPESTFDQNPAACPKASVVGSATVQTPILAATMAGPVYLVSKNGTGASTSSSGATSSKTAAAPASHPGESKIEKEEAAFPNLVLVLQGEGVRIDLSGALFVSTKNITSVTFRTIPDVPIRRLDLVLPEGKTSILAASAGLCTKKPLRMSTAITAQNGARLKPTVKVAVEGCKKPKRHKRHKRPKKKRRPRQK